MCIKIWVMGARGKGSKGRIVPGIAQQTGDLLNAVRERGSEGEGLRGHLVIGGLILRVLRAQI